MQTKVEELAKKLLALSQQGVGGEKENAEQFLQRLIKKYNLTIEELSEEKKEWHDFKIKKPQEKFFWQVGANVIGTTKYRGYSPPATGGSKIARVFCTMAQALEIKAKFEHYWKQYEKEQAIFYSAFIASANLYPAETSGSWDDLTAEEKAELRRVALMSQGIKTESFLKRLD